MKCNPPCHGAGDEDNYIVGLGLDLTSAGVAVEHPTDPNAPDLPPQPLLLVRLAPGAGACCVRSGGSPRAEWVSRAPALLCSGRKGFSP